MNQLFMCLFIYLLQLISHIENGEEDFKPDLYQAIGEVTRAWEQVTPKTIANCQRHGGFVMEDAQEEVEEVAAPVCEDLYIYLTT